MEVTKRSITNDVISFIDEQLDNSPKLINMIRQISARSAPGLAPAGGEQEAPEIEATPLAKSTQANPALQTTKDANTQILQRYGGLRNG